MTRNGRLTPIAPRLALTLLLALVALTVAVAPAAAISGSSSSGNTAAAQYPPDDETDDDTLGSPASGTASGDADGLPVTGFALLTLAGIGVFAVAGGVATRRVAQRPAD